MKQTRIVFQQKAREDIQEITDYIARDNSQAAVAFFDALEQACELLERMPQMGSVRVFRNPRLAGVRMWPIKKFESYLLFYQAGDKGIVVLRVLHGARDIPALFGEKQPREEDEEDSN